MPLSKLPASLNGDKEIQPNIGSNHNHPLEVLKWHQFHLWVGAKDFRFLEQLAKEEEESIAHIVRRLIRQFRLQAERSRQ